MQLYEIQHFQSKKIKILKKAIFLMVDFINTFLFIKLSTLLF